MKSIVYLNGAIILVVLAIFLQLHILVEVDYGDSVVVLVNMLAVLLLFYSLYTTLKDGYFARFKGASYLRFLYSMVFSIALLTILYSTLQIF